MPGRARRVDGRGTTRAARSASLSASSRSPRASTIPAGTPPASRPATRSPGIPACRAAPRRRTPTWYIRAGWNASPPAGRPGRWRTVTTWCRHARPCWRYDDETPLAGLRPAGAGPNAASAASRRRGHASRSVTWRASGTTMRSARERGQEMSAVVSPDGEADVRAVNGAGVLARRGISPEPAPAPSERRFADGAHYRIEIPSVEGPAVLRAVVAQASAEGVVVNRASQGSGAMLLSAD